MPFTLLAILAIIQGITEFLPVSSSGHLIILPKVFGAYNQGPLIDVAVHLGTLGAVILYFRSDVARIARGTARLCCLDLNSQDAHLTLALGVSTLPIVVAGFVIYKTGSMELLRNPEIIAWAMIVFALPLYLADRFSAAQRTRDWTIKNALIMGAAQILALIPGASRSGVTMTAGRMLKYDRATAARFSMLMSIPAILASSILLGADAAANGNFSHLGSAGLAALLAFIFAYKAIDIFMGLLARMSFTPFVVYRLFLGASLLIFFV